jgi:hypothetical protein
MRFSSLFFQIVFICTLYACKEPVKSTPIYALRSILGGPDSVVIDTKTPLNQLILRLEQPWKFVETGKGYWIGYTDDMYSIAYHKDNAVKPLLNLIKTSDSLKTKFGCLYTLHLIGINSHIAGRTSEEFKDTLSRKAILSLIGDKQLKATAMSLLSRDPWLFDIPYFIDYISKSDSNNLDVLRGLRPYLIKIKDRPLWQDLPEEILNKDITIKTNNFWSHPIADIIALKKTLKKRVEIDEEILKSKEWKNGLVAFASDTGEVRNVTYINEKEYIFIKPQISSIKSFNDNRYEYFLNFFHDDRFIYSYHDETLYILGPKKAREILLKWWTNIDKEK